MKIGIVFFMWLLVLSCNDTLPNGILEQEKMENILWEQMQADAFTREFISKDTSQKLVVENLKIQQKIFAQNNTNKETFYKSYQYYLEHAELFKPMIDSIVSKQTRIKQEDFIKKMANSKKYNWDWLKKMDTSTRIKKPFILKGMIIVEDSINTPSKRPAIIPFESFKKNRFSKEL